MYVFTQQIVLIEYFDQILVKRTILGKKKNCANSMRE